MLEGRAPRCRWSIATSPLATRPEGAAVPVPAAAPARGETRGPSPRGWGGDAPEPRPRRLPRWLRAGRTPQGRGCISRLHSGHVPGPGVGRNLGDCRTCRHCPEGPSPASGLHGLSLHHLTLAEGADCLGTFLRTGRASNGHASRTSPEGGRGSAQGPLRTTGSGLFLG